MLYDCFLAVIIFSQPSKRRTIFEEILAGTLGFREDNDYVKVWKVR